MGGPSKTDSFGALSFWTTEEEYDDSSEADVASEHIPWGNYTVTHLGGKGPEILRVKGLVDGYPRSTLRTLEGTQASLSTPKYSGTAVLRRWSIAMVHDGTGQSLATMEFVVDVD